MQLLVSVRSPREVDAALDGGADIVDAKDPARGALGAMDPDMLARVLDRVPPTAAFSAALGDPHDGIEAAALIASVPIPARPAPAYVKLGFASAGHRDAVERILDAAVAAASRHPGRLLVIAVAYADEPTAIGLEALLAVADQSGASGVLVDTRRKTGGSLLDAVPPRRLEAWIAEAHARRLLVGLAGRLECPDVALLAGSGADVVGVRGAACHGGRSGWVRAAKVRALRDSLGEIAEERPRAAKHQSGAPVAPLAGIRK